MRKCAACGFEEESGAIGQWWYLNKYYGLSGWFCPYCFDKVSHDSYDNPKYPEEYNTIAVKMKIKGM